MNVYVFFRIPSKRRNTAFVPIVCLKESSLDVFSLEGILFTERPSS